MANIKIREELGERVYECVLALANPETGIAQVKAPEVLAMIGCGKYEVRHISKAIQYLIMDKKLGFVADNGGLGLKLSVPALTKGNTVVKHIEPARPSRVEALFKDIAKASPSPVSAAQPAEPQKMTSKERATRMAEQALSDTNTLVGEVLTAFMQTRDALERLVKEVRKNG